MRRLLFTGLMSGLVAIAVLMVAGPTALCFAAESSPDRDRVVGAVPADDTAPADQNSKPTPGKERPIVRMVSPANGGAFVMPESESEILIVIEIVDVSGSGIVSDDSGTPRFLDPDPNVKLFMRYLSAKHRYIDSRNQSVIQLVAEVPVAKLVPEKDRFITSPVDWKKVSPAWRKHGFEVSAAGQFAAFSFRVKDGRGMASEDEKPDIPTLIVGFASSAYVPEGNPPTEEAPSAEDHSDKP